MSAKELTRHVIQPRCQQCEESNNVYKREIKYINPCPYYHRIPYDSKVLAKEFNSPQKSCIKEENEYSGRPVQNGTRALAALDMFDLPAISFFETLVLLQPDNDAHFTMSRIGDLCGAIKLVNPKNVTKIDFYIMETLVLSVPYESGKDIIRFYQDEVISLGVNHTHANVEQKDGILFCDINAIPLIALCYVEVKIKIDGSVDSIQAEYIYLSKDLRKLVVSHPGYFSLNPNTKLRYNKGVIEEAYHE